MMRIASQASSMMPRKRAWASASSLYYTTSYKSLPSFPTRRSSDLRILIDEVQYVPADRFTFAIGVRGDRKSTRLNSSHVSISYAVFCLKKKNDPKARVGVVGLCALHDYVV